MANEFIISRVSALPVPLVANTMYIVKAVGSDLAELVFVGNNVANVAKTISYSQVDQMVQDAAEAAVLAGKSVFVVADIAERNALNPTIPVIAYVKDTSGDPLATTASGTYVYDLGSGVWLPMSSGGAGTNVNWNDINGRPASSPAQIDTAVASSIHANRSVLNALGDSNGKLTYGGQPVSDVTVEANW